MGAQPWMKFYPADWRADPALRSCSLAARGLWMEMLAIMHEAEPRGHLLINGRAVEVRQLASLSGAILEEAQALIDELEDAGVFSRKKNAVIFSRRMEKDENRTRKLIENGKKGGNPTLCNHSEKTDLDNQVDKTQKPEARYQIPEEEKKGSAPGGAAQSASEIIEFDPKTILYRQGRGWLMSALNASDSQARKQIGLWMKASGDDPLKVLDAFRRCREARPADPKSWLHAAFKASRASTQRPYDRDRMPLRSFEEEQNDPNSPWYGVI